MKKINDTSKLYKIYGLEFPLTCDLVAKFIFGVKDSDNEIIKAIKNNKICEYDLSSFFINYEYNWQSDIYFIEDYLSKLIN